MNNLINSKVLHENVKAFTPNDIVLDENTDLVDDNIEAIETNQIDIQADNDNPIEEEFKDSTMSDEEKETLEWQIERAYSETTDLSVNSFNEANAIIYESVNDLESFAIQAINKQYKILSECGYGTDEYLSEMEIMTESTAGDIISKIIDWIKELIKKAQKILSDIGVTVSVSLNNYSAFVEQNGKELMEKADKYGDRVEVKVYEYNDDLLKSVNLSKAYNAANKAVPGTIDENEMEKISDKVAEKYESVIKLQAAVYCKAFEDLCDGDFKINDVTDMKMVYNIYCAKLKNNEKTKYMKTKLTREYLDKLKNYRTNANQVLSTTRHSINPEFKKMISEMERKRNDKSLDVSVTNYYRIRYAAMSGAQMAVNDILRIKSDYIREYGKQMYNALKTLKSYNEETIDECIIDNRDYVNFTLTESSNILNEVSANSILSASAFAAIFIAGIGVMIHDAKQEKKFNESKKEREKQNEEYNKKLLFFIEQIHGSKTEIKIASAEDLINHIIKDIKILVNITKTNPKVKEAIAKTIESSINDYILDFIKDEGYNYDNCPKDILKKIEKEAKNDHKFTLKVEEERGSGDGCVSIIDGSQYIKIVLSKLLNIYIDALKNKWKEALSLYKVNLNKGDGDEGCIYWEYPTK